MKHVALAVSIATALLGCGSMPEPAGSWRGQLDTARMPATGHAAADAGVHVSRIDPPPDKQTAAVKPS